MIKTIGTILACQFAAPLSFMSWPRFTKLKIKSVKVCEEVSEGLRQANIFRPFAFYGCRLPKRTVIDCLDSRGSRVWFTISHEDKTVASNGSILQAPYGGSGEIGVMIIGLPGLILFSPLLILNGITWSVIKAATGMDRYAWAVWLRLKNQLEPETKKLLEVALKGK